MNIVDSLFSWFIAATVRGSLLALAVLAIQVAFGGRMPARWRYALWLPVVFVLASPFLPQSRWSVENRFVAKDRDVPSLAPAAWSPVPLYHGTVVDEGLWPSVEAGDRPPAARWRRIVEVVWLAGIAVMLALALFVYGRTMRRMRGRMVPTHAALATMLSDLASVAGLAHAPRVLVSTAVRSPAVAGLLRPLLLLPADFPNPFTPAEARLVLLHELTHLKRNDLPLNWLLFVLQAIHWCNPVLWFGFARIRADRESACDAQVLDMTSEDHRAEYGHALLKLEVRFAASGLNLGFLGFLGIFERTSEMRSRIRAIAAYRGASRSWGIVAAALVAALTLCGATRAQNQGEDGEPSQEPPLSGGQGASASGSAQIQRKLNEIIFPRLEFREATIEEAIVFIRKRSAELDTAEPEPGKRGVNIVLRVDTNAGRVPVARIAPPVVSTIPGLEPLPSSAPAPAGPPAFDPGKARITVSLANIPLIEVLKYVTELASVKFRIAPHAVEILPVDVRTNVFLTKEYKVSADLGLKPGVDPKEFLIAGGLVFSEGASAALSPDGSRLIVRNTQENLDIVDELLFAAGDAAGGGLIAS